MSQIVYKKMKNAKGFGFFAQCDCGHIHKFKSIEIDLENSHKNIAIFKDIYQCPNCGNLFDGIADERAVVRGNRRRTMFVVYALLIFGVIFGGYKIVNSIINPPAYENINNATNQQLQDFYKWDEKQQQQKLDNQPAFNNSK